jgi:phosphatidylserine/phosphatidylglycerophosphate/cardiolipin synthase-like enzyme
MTRKRRSRNQTSSALALLGLLFLLVLGGTVFGWDSVEGVLGELLGNPPVGGEEPVGEAPVAVEPSSGGGSFYQVYFTDPAHTDPDSGNGPEQHIIALINNAQSTIDAAMFEFNLQDVADALIAAQQRGVTVRVVYDDEHTEDDPQMEELIDAGIPAVPDERGAYMHDKFYVIDGLYVWTGSMNFTVNGAYFNNNNAIVIRSTQLAANYTAEFEEMFNGEFGPSSPANTPNPRINVDGTLIENYFGPEDDVMDKLISTVSEATSSIHIMIFSFTNDDLGNAVLERAQQGVQVVAIFEQRGANTDYSECPTMLADGLDVRLDGNPRTFHHKVMIVDGSTVVTGSFNFSDSANEDNDENVLIIHNTDIAALYEAEFNRRLAEAQMPVGGECLSE